MSAGSDAPGGGARGGLGDLEASCAAWQTRVVRRRTAPTVLLAVALVAGCGSAATGPESRTPGPSGAPGPGSSTPTPTPTPTPTGAPPRPEADPAPGEYLAGLPARVELPGSSPAAVVVLVPGGGWATADPSSLAPLGEHLRAAGLATVTITYGTSSTGSSWPVPADDVRCAVAFAAEQVPGVPVVLAGHSAGAHLAAVVGLAPAGADAFCPYPDRAADGVVGLAGPYDVSATAGLAGNLFGVAEPEAPALWAEGNPLLLAGERPDVPFLLLHGDADRLVGEEFARDLDAALAEGGHPVRVEVLAGATHSGILRPEVSGDVVAGWVLETLVG